MLIYDGVEPIDIGGTIGVISMASRLIPGLTATTIARHAGAVRLAGGLTVIADHGFDDAPDCAVVIVTGGPGWRSQAGDPETLAFLRRLPVTQVASVCTGALILGAAGLLDGHKATTRRSAAPGEASSPLNLLVEQGAMPIAAQLVEPPGGPLTGGGVSLAHDLTLHIIERLHGEAARDSVARLIEYDRAFEANRRALGRA